MFNSIFLDFSFSTNQELDRHFSLLHSERPFKCPLCDARFVQKGGMQTHIDTVHHGKKPYNCPNCDTKFSAKQKLESHNESKHDPHNLSDKILVQDREVKKPYLCIVCEKNFSKSHNLKLHMISNHTRIKLYQCSDCDDSFPTNPDLKKTYDITQRQETFQMF